MFTSFTSVATCRATPTEVRRPLPGDALIAHPIVSLTYAITIDVPPDRVWPWLVQMGCGRAGWYSYDRLDNGGRPSSTRIQPAWQQLAIGDVLPGAPGMRDAFVVVDFLAGTMLLLGVPTGQGRQVGQTPARDADAGTPAVAAAAPAVRMTWCFLLEETTAHHTRLLTRARADRTLLVSPSRTPLFAPFATPSELFYRVPFPSPLWRVLATLIHYIMQQRQLVQIKERAERHARVVRSPLHNEAGGAASRTAGGERRSRGKVKR